MRYLPAVLILLAPWICQGASPSEVMSANMRSVVYLQVEDATGGRVTTGTGFVVSQEGHVVTADHISVGPGQRLMGILGQREGTKFPLSRVDQDPASDTALWKLPQSAACRTTVMLTQTPVKVFDRAIVLGFPGSEGLTPSTVSVINRASALGFYKSDGYLQEGFSGGPVFNEAGKVIAIVQGGTLPGTENNDLVPIFPAIALLKKHGVRASIDQQVAYDDHCYAKCRAREHGIESWGVVTRWGPVNSGWMDGGHSRGSECSKLIAGALAGKEKTVIELDPGEGSRRQGMWEESKRDVLGHVEYRYFCQGTMKSNPIYVEKQSEVCGLWD